MLLNELKFAFTKFKMRVSMIYRVIDFVFLKKSKSCKYRPVCSCQTEDTKYRESSLDESILYEEAYRKISPQRNAFYVYTIDHNREFLILN